MKIARLPSGEMLEFPPETPDEDMTRHVKKTMGIPVVPTGEETRHGENTQLAAQRNQALGVLTQQVGQLSQIVAKLCADQQTTQRLLQQVAGSIQQLGQTIGVAAQRVEAAVMAPARQEVERAEDGSIKSTTITKGGR